MSSSTYTSTSLHLIYSTPSYSGEPVEDENGYSHLLPASQSLRAVDTYLTRVLQPSRARGCSSMC